MLLMEGFTNVEVASHGLECVEKMLLFREQALITWKKWMEINKGDVASKQHLGEVPHADASDPVMRQRVSHEAQMLTQAMMSIRGWADPQVKATMDRSAILLRQLDQSSPL